MIVSIHQPDYIPYLGFFYKMWRADAFVFLDDAQYSCDSTHNWNKVKTPQGECRIKIPVDYKFGDAINIVRTKDELKWKEKHLKTIEMNYTRAHYFQDFFPLFKDLLLANYNNISEQNITINSAIAEKLGIKPKFYKSSNMHVSTAREERVIDIVKNLGGVEYISGLGGKVYEVEEHFTARGVKLTYTDYLPVHYKQLWEKQQGFLINMSVIDYIMNCGYDFDYVVKAVKENNEKQC